MKIIPNAGSCSLNFDASLELVVWILVLLLTAVGSSAQEKRNRQPGKKAEMVTANEVELRGRVVCLAEEMHRLHGAELPAKHEHIYGFKTGDGKYYTLLRTKYSEAIFADEQIRARELVLKGRLFSSTQIFEPITLRSIRNGVVHDLLYYCEVCEIYAVAPAICECCQGLTELIEKPIRP